MADFSNIDTYVSESGEAEKVACSLEAYNAADLTSFRKSWRGALRFMFQAQELLDNAAHPVAGVETGKHDDETVRTPFSPADADLMHSAQNSVKNLRMILANQGEGAGADEKSIIESLETAVNCLSQCGFGADMLEQLKPEKVPKYEGFHIMMSRILCGGHAPLRGDADELRRMGITHILSLTSKDGQQPCIPAWISSTRQRRIIIEDAEDANMRQHFKEICDFIASVRSGRGKIYVHSLAGISRAPTAIAAYLIRAGGLSFVDAMSMVRRGRCCSRPNKGFIRQLQLWEKDFSREKAVPGAKLEKKTNLGTTEQRDRHRKVPISKERIRGENENADRFTLRQKQSVARRSVRSPLQRNAVASMRPEINQRAEKDAPTTSVLLTQSNITAGFLDVAVGSVAVRVPVPDGFVAGQKLVLDMQLLSNHAMDHILADAAAVQRAADDMKNTALLRTKFSGDVPKGGLSTPGEQQLPPPLIIDDHRADDMSDLSD